MVPQKRVAVANQPDCYKNYFASFRRSYYPGNQEMHLSATRQRGIRMGASGLEISLLPRQYRLNLAAKGISMLSEQPLLIVVVTLLAVLAVYLLMLFVAAKGDFRRIRLALRCELRVLRDPSFAAKVEALLAPPKPEPPPKPSGAPLRLLALLQREGRLLDFLLEDVQSYPDAQIGAAVRDIHRRCQSALKEHLELQPVLPQAEGSTVEIPSGFDPSAVRLTGNVTGQPPFRGTLQHHGWRVKQIKLAPPPEGQDEFVLMPAEVDLP